MKILKRLLPGFLLAFCSLAHAGYAEGEPACKSGQVLDAGLCYEKCQPGETGAGPLCLGSCPAGTRDIGAICSGTDIRTKASYNRGVGVIPRACAPGQVNEAGLCYQPCRAGFHSAGPVCWENTPSGWSDAGLWFWRWDWGIKFRSKVSYGRGAGTAPSSCSAGMQYNAGLCYTPCRADYSGAASMCLANCPAGYINDGLTCRRETTVAKTSRVRGAGVLPPGNEGLCSFEMPLTTKSGSDRLYSQTAWVGTHNAYANTSDGYVYAMQSFEVRRQLEGGVRVINLDLHLLDNEIVMCHENCNGAPGLNFGRERKKLVDTLKVIKSFLDSNRSEIVTLLFESYVKDPAKLDAAFTDAGLRDMAFIPTNAGISQFPTLKQMIADNKRLVVLSQESADANDTSATRKESSYFVENTFGFNSSVDRYAVSARNLPLDTPDRGFLLNHFSSTSMPLVAAADNRSKVLNPRAMERARAAANGRLPTILLVDYYHLPFCEAFKTVKDINDSF